MIQVETEQHMLSKVEVIEETVVHVMGKHNNT